MLRSVYHQPARMAPTQGTTDAAAAKPKRVRRVRGGRIPLPRPRPLPLASSGEGGRTFTAETGEVRRLIGAGELDERVGVVRASYRERWRVLPQCRELEIRLHVLWRAVQPLEKLGALGFGELACALLDEPAAGRLEDLCGEFGRAGE